MACELDSARPAAYECTAQSDHLHDESVWSFLQGCSLSQWSLLLYPVFLCAIYRQRDFDSVSSVDTSALLQIAFTAVWGLYALHRFLTAEGRLRWLLRHTSLMWLVLYCAFAVVSTSWSGLPTLTLFRSGQALIFLILVADALATVGTLQDLVKLQLCYSAILAVFWQWSLLQYGWSLTNLHSSQIPGALVGISFTGFLIQGTWWRVLHVFAILTILVGTSAATFVSALVGLAVTVLAVRGGLFGGAVLLAIGATLAFVFPKEVKETVFYGKTEQNIRTASGRLPTWEWLVERQMQERPAFGFGFGYGEVQARLYNKRGLRMQHMHSSVMSALVNLGAAGLGLLVFFWISLWRHLTRVRTATCAPFLFGAVAAVWVNSLAIDSVTSPLGFGWIGHMLVYGTAFHLAQEA